MFKVTDYAALTDGWTFSLIFVRVINGSAVVKCSNVVQGFFRCSQGPNQLKLGDFFCNFD